MNEENYPVINLTITETKINSNPQNVSEKFKKNFRKMLYISKVDNYGLFIDGIHGESFYYDLTTRKKLSREQLKRRRFKTSLMGKWFNLTYKIFYKRRYK